MADLPKVDKIWMDGELVDWDKAQVHVLTHALHYGSGVFEGIRCYETPDGPAVFRLTEHMERLERSAKALRMNMEYSVDDLVEATKALIRANKLPSCYIRPLVFKGYGVMGLNPLPCSEQTIIAVWPWESYLGEEALQQGITAGISSWRQRGINSTPPGIKATGNYLNSSLAKIESLDNGYDEAILLNEDGHVCEGTGENLFIVRDEILMTPPVSDGILEGITRATIIALADDLDIDVVESSLVRTDLYAAEEAFVCGTAAEVVPIREVDHREIGGMGPITKMLQEKYFEVVRGRDAEYEYWLERV
jgi:branched-chain amino acid aminotransferase